MSSKVADFAALVADPMESRPAVRGPAATGGRAVAAVLAPAVAAVAALLAHRFLPNNQIVPTSWVDPLQVWLHPYPVVLEALLAASLVLAAAQWPWRPLRPWVRHNAPLLAGAILVFSLWELTTLKLNWLVLPYFPGPDQVLAGMVEARKPLFESTWHSLRLLLSGYAAGVAAGLVTGVLIGWFPHVRYWGMPVLKAIGPIPATALVPLVMTLFSQSFTWGTALIGFAVWFPVTMLTASGIANVRLSYLDVARTLGAGRLYLIFRVAIPAALPHIFLGLFMGLSASFLTLIVAETLGVKAGLGYYQQLQKGYMEYDKMFASLLIMAAFFSGIMTLLFKARDRVLGWQKGVIRW
ncbi:MAG TPA: ABC transporter permease subunit [Gemmataceae bacterium]|jgi:NitT/TauT family transport system permease protein|nr:ABC transporter permease subunit [Gemmataceae bacterium]